MLSEYYIHIIRSRLNAAAMLRRFVEPPTCTTTEDNRDDDM